MRAQDRPVGTVLAVGVFSLAVWTFLVWSLASQHSYRARYSEYAVGQSAEDARKEIQTVCAAEKSPTDYVACTERALATERDNRRADYDLQAQQDMAQWAIVMTAISAAQAVVGAVGLYFLVGSFRQTAIQAHAAQRAIAKATVANVIARDTALNDQRPWLSLRPFTNDAGGITEASIVPGVVVEVTNFGKTPAINVVGDHRIRSSFGAISIKSEMQRLADEVRLSIDHGLFDAAIVPNGKGYEFINKTISIKEGAVSVLDGKTMGSAIIIIAVAYQSPTDSTVRTTAGAFQYNLISDPMPAAPNKFKGFIQNFPGGSIIN